MTILELKQTIEIMRTVYPFKDKETQIDLIPNLRSGRFDTVEIMTTDAASGTQVRLSREIERDGESRVN